MREKEYEVYFEIFGKKMKTTLKAVSEFDAQQKVLKKVVFHKCEEANPLKNLFKGFEDIFKPK